MTLSPFDPEWRDDVYDLRALRFDLALPEPTPNNGSMWVAQRPARDEIAFGKLHPSDGVRRVTSIVTRSRMMQGYTMRDERGVEVPLSNPIYDMVFPPKAWMSDSLEERCMMLAAAQMARGDVLVGGLGLAVYPQMAFELGRPLRSLTIVEESDEVIKIVHPGWMKHLSYEDKGRVRVVHSTIQRFIAETQAHFDTVFLDVWTDADPRWLPFVNGLIERAAPRCAPEGAVQCWGYAVTVDAFVRDAVNYVEHAFPLEEYNLDPAMQRLAGWVSEHPAAPREQLALEARSLARSVSSHDDAYDRDEYLGSYAPTRAMAQILLARARKRPERS